jgi:hypothetical protein
LQVDISVEHIASPDFLATGNLQKTSPDEKEAWAANALQEQEKNQDNQLEDEQELQHGGSVQCLFSDCMKGREDTNPTPVPHTPSPSSDSLGNCQFLSATAAVTPKEVTQPQKELILPVETKKHPQDIPVPIKPPPPPPLAGATPIDHNLVRNIKSIRFLVHVSPKVLVF